MFFKKEKRISLTPAVEMIAIAWRQYWLHIISFIKMIAWSLWAFVPLFILSLLAFVLQEVLWLKHVSLTAAFAVLVTLAFLFCLYFLARTYLSFFLMIKNDFKKKTVDQFRESKNLVWPYINLIFLIIVFLVPIFLISVAFLVSINILPLAPLFLAVLLFGALILFALAVSLAVFFGLAVFSLVFEKLSAPVALKRSIFLIEKYWWAVLGRMLFYAFLLWVFSLLLAMPLAYFSPESSWALAWQGLINIIDVLLIPLYLIYMSIIYRDLVKIKGRGLKFEGGK